MEEEIFFFFLPVKLVRFLRSCHPMDEVIAVSNIKRGIYTVS